MFNNSPVREEPPRAAFLAGVPRLWPAPLASQNENVGLYVEGTVTGPKLKGMVKGVDYANVRADGRLQLHVHAGITTEDCMSSEHFGRLGWQFKRISGPSGFEVQSARAC